MLYPERGIAVKVFRLSVRDVELLRSHRLEFFETDFTADSLRNFSPLAEDPNVMDLLQREQPDFLKLNLAYLCPNGPIGGFRGRPSRLRLPPPLATDRRRHCTPDK